MLQGRAGQGRAGQGRAGQGRRTCCIRIAFQSVALGTSNDISRLTSSLTSHQLLEHLADGLHTSMLLSTQLAQQKQLTVSRTTPRRTALPSAPLA